MKPNGKYLVVRAVFLALCAVGLLSISGSAETMRGTFKLPIEAHWGSMVLAPGEYEFNLNNNPSGSMITVRSKTSGWSGMIMSAGSSDMKANESTRLLLGESGEGVYVRALCLADSGLMLNYPMPKAGKTVKLVKGNPAPATMASAAGGQ